MGVVDENNIDSEVSASLLFSPGEDGKQGIGQFVCSFSSNPPCEALIVGENGYVKINDPFWCATKLSVKIHKNFCKPQDVEFALPNSNDETKYNFTNSVLLQYEARYACRKILEGAKESEIFGLDDSIRIMKVLDELREQIGVKYPNEGV